MTINITMEKLTLTIIAMFYTCIRNDWINELYLLSINPTSPQSAMGERQFFWKTKHPVRGFHRDTRKKSLEI